MFHLWNDECTERRSYYIDGLHYVTFNILIAFYECSCLFVLQLKPLIKKSHKPWCETQTLLLWSSAKTYNNDIWCISDFQERLDDNQDVWWLLVSIGHVNNSSVEWVGILVYGLCDDNHKESTTNQKEATTNQKEATTNHKEATTNQKEATTNQKEATTNHKEATTNQKKAYS